MDGWHRIGLDDNFPIRQALPVWGSVLVLSAFVNWNTAAIIVAITAAITAAGISMWALRYPALSASPLLVIPRYRLYTPYFLNGANLHSSR